MSISKKGMVDDAIAEYKKALTIKPDYAKAHCTWSCICEQEDV